MEREWAWRRPEGDPPARLCEALATLDRRHGLLLARLLWSRGVEDPDQVTEFVHPTLARGLRSPLLMKDLGRAAERLADAIDRGEPIGVYGDYDVDGMTGAAELVLCLRELGVEPLLHISHREREGYGLSADGLRGLRSDGARVVVTADLGTSNPRELALGEELGLDVIVCDHHHAPTTRPPAWALLNPLQPGCAFPFKGLSGAGVVFYLLMGVRMVLRARGRSTLPDLRRLLDLVALGTVADVMPLREENRVLVAHGLRELNQTLRPGIRALKDIASVDQVSVRAIGFRLAPRLNAGGRLADARLGVELLTTWDEDRACALAAELEVHNAVRREIEERMVLEAVALAEGQRSQGAVVVAQRGWHHGVVGIVAARLADRFRVPSLVVALDENGGRGSGRTSGGVDLLRHLAACADLLEGHGGHRQAVGFRVQEEGVDALRERFRASVEAEAPSVLRSPKALEIDAEVSLAEVTSDLARSIARLEPHGTGNPAPSLVAHGVRVEGVRLVGEAARPHLRMRLRQDGRTLPAIAFGLGDRGVVPGDRLDVVFAPRLELWQGAERLELEVTDLRQSAVDGIGQVS